MREHIPVFIGYDPREAVAWHVCTQSILDNCSEPDRIQFYAVTGDQRDGSNAFIYARFLIPWRMTFRGFALFMDGDMVVRGDILELWETRHASRGVNVVKHPDYETKHPVKYFGNKNENYPRKNWSSVILWNNAFFPNRILTPQFVAEATGAFLHRFEWLKDEQIGGLPEGWNRLVLEQEVQPDDKLLHYTIAIPPLAGDYAHTHAGDWWAAWTRLKAPM